VLVKANFPVYSRSIVVLYHYIGPDIARGKAIKTAVRYSSPEN